MFLREASAKTNAVNRLRRRPWPLQAHRHLGHFHKKTKPEELLFIVGHEMVALRSRPRQKGFAYFFALLFVALLLGYHLLQVDARSLGSAWRIHGQSDWAALGVLLMLLKS